MPGAFDPTDTAAIGEALARHISTKIGPASVEEGPARFRSGLDTFVYAFRLSGQVPAEWSGPLVLRIFPSMDQREKAEREFAVQEFVAARGYPAPRQLYINVGGEPFGLPFIIMVRVPGVPAIDRLKNPLAILSMVTRMAILQARLHTLSTQGCPLTYDRPLIDRRLEQSRSLIAQYHPAGVDEPLRWLDEHAPPVRDEDPALTHNDFHPMNLIADGNRLTLLDWSDAALGDRHCDLARTLALFWLAPAFERSLVGRTTLRLLRRPIISRYEKVYASHLPFERRRIRYWQALHAFNAWVQIATMRQEGEAAIGARQGALSDIPAGLLDTLKRFFEERAA